MGKNDKIKNQPLRVVTSEDELANMLKNRDQFVHKLGQETYDRLVKKLEEHIHNTRKRPQSATPTSEL